MTYQKVAEDSRALLKAIDNTRLPIQRELQKEVDALRTSLDAYESQSKINIIDGALHLKRMKEESLELPMSPQRQRMIIVPTIEESQPTPISVESLKKAGLTFTKSYQCDGNDSKYDINLAGSNFYCYTVMSGEPCRNVTINNDEMNLEFSTIEEIQAYLEKPHVTLDDWWDDDSEVRKAADGFITANRSLPMQAARDILKKHHSELKEHFVDDRLCLWTDYGGFVNLPQEDAMAMINLGFVIDTDLECWRDTNSFHWYQPRVGFGEPTFDPKLTDEDMKFLFKRFLDADERKQELYSTPDDRIFTKYDLAVKNVGHGHCNIKGEPEPHVATWSNNLTMIDFM